MRVECSTLISVGLSYVLHTSTIILLILRIEAITRNKKVVMNYTNHDISIIQKYLVKLDGWPPSITFASPHNIHTVDEIRLLRHHLRENKCKWIRLTEEEVRKHMEQYVAKVRDGIVATRKRKIRSDKGKPRKKRAVEVDEEDENFHEDEDGPREDDGDEGLGEDRRIRRSRRVAKGKYMPSPTRIPR